MRRQVRVVGVHLVEVESRPYLALVQETAPGGDLGWQIEDCDFHTGRGGAATLVSSAHPVYVLQADTPQICHQLLAVMDLHSAAAAVHERATCAGHQAQRSLAYQKHKRAAVNAARYTAAC
jgi:hypothetical protein